ncbi:MAG: adenylate/guanylate cyclase domain-containing protein [Cycloclasticus sp.]|nr:adenylate/guanylate cyclase domain-containing protein [Cycloclasticus sp.]
MTENGMQRQLKAILSADVKGYSKLMGDDDESTVNTITVYRKIVAELINEHQGRVVDSPGDNILAEFGSTLNAVNSAVEIQRTLEAENHKLPDHRRMVFRIGINMGDIIHKDDRIYGDGVNVAARIESLADPGGICISRGVYNQVKNKVSQGFEYLGEHAAKNIAEPVTIYRVLLAPDYNGRTIGEPKAATAKLKKPAVVAIATLLIASVALLWIFYPRVPEIEPASVEKMAYPLPNKPSIAVLPFDNMSDDPKQAYLSDGITEDIITSLSKTDQLFVIARNSTFTYKNKPVKMKQVAEELGVRYVLEGSLQKSADRVRITAQLIDATSGHHLWAERYEGDLKDIFALQDEITMKIITTLQVELTEGEQARIWSNKAKNLDLLLKRMEAMSLWNKGTKESFVRYGQVVQETINMAPEVSWGYVNLGWYYWRLAFMGISPKENVAKAYKLAQKAITMDESDSYSHSLLGSVYLLMRQHEKAIAAGERAVTLNPNGAFDHGILGATLSYAEKEDEAIGYLKQGIRLDPFPASWYFAALGRCYRQKGQYEEALKEFNKALHISPGNIGNHLSLAIIYPLLNRQEEANVAAKKILEMNPNFSVEIASKGWPYKNQTDLNIVVNALHKAGLK